ncbi:MAG: FHA domain-containing protein [Acidobacteriota bacterium]|nr:MAG: FHA domain-containing protein [Acidobacteriota bacterium]
MLICPVCRSQNMDTAKFCGNCGNPFTPQNESTSSLINCSQGHIYSAVYQYCPYCPQPEGADPANFATRVEEAAPITSGAETGSGSQPINDFSTRIDTGETIFETVETPVVKAPAPMPPTEVISSHPAYEEMIGSVTSSSKPTEVEPRRVAEEDHAVLEVEQVVENKPVDLAPPPPPAPQSRHTIVAAAADSPDASSKGKIVGWLVTYTGNPDGSDFRVYSGYNRIGANPVCDIIIEDETVSGSHAIIVYRDGRCLIKDDLSRNGTYVNGREISEAHPLQNYDQIRIGNTYLTYVSAEKPQ